MGVTDGRCTLLCECMRMCSYFVEEHQVECVYGLCAGTHRHHIPISEIQLSYGAISVRPKFEEIRANELQHVRLSAKKSKAKKAQVTL